MGSGVRPAESNRKPPEIVAILRQTKGPTLKLNDVTPSKDFVDFSSDLDKIAEVAHFKLIIDGKPGLSPHPLNGLSQPKGK